MKKVSIIGLVFLVLIGLLSAPGGAQEPGLIPGATEITQILNHIELIAITLNAIKQLEVLLLHLENIDDVLWREILGILEDVRAVAASGAINYVLGADAPLVGAEIFPVNAALDFNVEEIPIFGVFVEWQEIAQTSLFGGLGAAGVVAQDAQETHDALEHLRELADAAEGTGQAAHVTNMYLALAAQEAAKTNEAIAALVQSTVVAPLYQRSIDSLQEATFRGLIEVPDLTDIPVP